MDIRCVFEEEISSKTYTCCLSSLNITERWEVNSFVGTHKAGRSNKDVKALFIDFSKLHHLPKGIGKFFPNLTYIRVINCNLREITTEAFSRLDQLECLNFNSNYLITLPDNLFTKLKKLNQLDVSNNRLEFLNPRMFDHLPEKQLLYVDFSNNYKIDILFCPGNRKGLKCLSDLKNAVAAAFKEAKTDLHHEDTLKEFKQTSSNGFKKLWELKNFSDLTIFVGVKEFHVHKCVLSIQSSVFASMLENDEQVKISNKLEIKDCNEEVFDEFLCCLYTGEIAVEKLENPLEFFVLACTFNVPHLMTIGENLVATEINNLNAVTALKLGDLYNSNKIVEAAFARIRSIYSEVNFPESLKNKPEEIERMVIRIERIRNELQQLNKI